MLEILISWRFRSIGNGWTTRQASDVDVKLQLQHCLEWVMFA